LYLFLRKKFRPELSVRALTVAEKKKMIFESLVIFVEKGKKVKQKKGGETKSTLGNKSAHNVFCLFLSSTQLRITLPRLFTPTILMLILKNLETKCK